jgi:hypothetical protein
MPQQFARDQAAPAKALGEHQLQRRAFLLAAHAGKGQKDDEERGERLENEGRSQLTKPQQQRGLARFCKIGAVLAVPFEEDRVAGEAVHARIEEGERGDRTEHELSVMHHAVRMAIGLRIEGFVNARLIARAIRLDGAAPIQAGETGNEYQQDEQRPGDQTRAVARQHAPFLARNQRGRAHAAAPAWA